MSRRQLLDASKLSYASATCTQTTELDRGVTTNRVVEMEHSILDRFQSVNIVSTGVAASSSSKHDLVTRLIDLACRNVR